jgi:hypothetical protein
MKFHRGLSVRVALAIASLVVSATCLVPSTAEAGCRCGRSYISESYTCHKCTCECPKCDYSDCRMPDMLAPLVAGTELERLLCDLVSQP